jgi:enoyl-[acyl-carrier-protein] reductase (NADH)
MANVDDLTWTLLFLLSDVSKYITGQNIVIDGGWSL